MVWIKLKHERPIRTNKKLSDSHVRGVEVGASGYVMDGSGCVSGIAELDPLVEELEQGPPIRERKLNTSVREQNS